MLIDLHAHTFPKSDDSFLAPAELFRQAKVAELDGVCLTEHDTFWDEDTLARWSREHGLIVLPACEINTEEGHLLAFGLTRYVFGMHRAAFVRMEVDAAAGALVAAHPYRRAYSPQTHKDPASYNELLDRVASRPLWSLADAVEGLNGRGSAQENRFSLDLARRLGKPSVGAGDAHKATDVGASATRFLRPIGSVRDLVRELKAGRCEPVALRAPWPQPFCRAAREAR